ncbi:MAG: energy-coupling factor ABC transporter ATP-binding protein [Candidatus Limnocylindria bacterium]
MSESLVEVSGLVHVFPNGVQALDGIDLRIQAGERLAIIGQNGSGKSTLVRHFVGLLRATSGEVQVAGRPVGSRHVAELARTVAIAFQNPDRQIFAARVREEVAFGPRNLGLRGGAIDERVATALAAVGLERLGDANPYDLGYSRRKLLALASVLAMGAPMVVLDEPTTGQDARGVRLVESVVAELSAGGTTVVVISHDMRFVAEAAARVVVMRAGRIVGDGSPATVFSEPEWPVLRSTYLEPTLAARVGASLGLGPTPTEEVLVARALDAERTLSDRG